MSFKKDPAISVIIPLYNHERYIEEAIYSVLEQSFSDFELIIINDGSTDNSEIVVSGIKDDRIRYYRQDNRGAYNAINRGINLSQGRYISILNSDDVYYPERLAECFKIIEANSTIHAVFSQIELIDEKGEHIGFKKGAEENWLGYDNETSWRGSNNIFLSLFAGNFLHTSSNLFCRKSVFDDIGYFSNFRYTHDYDFFLRLSYYYKTHFIDRPLLKYRFHGSNTISEDYAESNFETAIVLSNVLIKYDLKRFFQDDQICDFMAKFFNSINTYDTDRIIMTILLFGLRYNKLDSFIELLYQSDNAFKRACIDRMKKFRDTSLLKERLSWQEGQTELWWRKAEEFKNALEWQKQQTELWWKKAEELKDRAETLKNILNAIHNSYSWKVISRLNTLVDKMLPVQIKDFLKKLFKRL